MEQTPVRRLFAVAWSPRGRFGALLGSGAFAVAALAFGGCSNTITLEPSPSPSSTAGPGGTTTPDPNGGGSGGGGNTGGGNTGGGNTGGGGGGGGGGGTTTGPGGTGVVGAEAVAAWDALAATEKNKVKAAKVFFGHQSVGWNTLEGVESLGGFTVDEISGASSYGTPKIGHAYLDSNTQPLDKMQNFDVMMGRIGSTVQVAGMKLCWIDFESGTNVTNLQNTYKATITKVKAAYPNVHLFHVTTPVKTDEASLNAMRLQYGDWLKNTYKNEAIVLDLAAVQSTQPNGAACTSGGTRNMCAAYASDEGHLNATGQARAAKAFLYAVYKSL